MFKNPTVFILHSIQGEVTVRNNESLAHDNELVDPAEARFIFDSVVSTLRFLKAYRSTLR